MIFMDPPYRMDFERQVLIYLKDSSLADSRTLIVAEAALDTDFSWLFETGYRILKNKEYKTNKHLFIEKDLLTADTKRDTFKGR